VSLRLVGPDEEPAPVVLTPFADLTCIVGPAYRAGTTLDPDNLRRAREIEADLLDANRRPDLDHNLDEQQAHLDRCVINRYDAAVLALDLLPTLMRRASTLIREHADGGRRPDLDHDLASIGRFLSGAADAIDGSEPW
jgi:hypothetical protein